MISTARFQRKRVCTTVACAMIAFARSTPALAASESRDPSTAVVAGSQPDGDVPPPSADPCDVNVFAKDPPTYCRTPRYGQLSGGFLALDIGLVTLSRAAQDRIGVGPGALVQVRFALEFWDTLAVGSGITGIFPHDDRPVSQMVVDCTAVNGVTVGCDNQSHAQQSGVSAALLPLEAGLQYRLRPWRTTSWVPGVMLGYDFALGGPSRAVSCDGCDSTRLDATVSGAYLAPFFRMTIGATGMFALEARTAWFLTGDLQQMTTLGFQAGVP